MSNEKPKYQDIWISAKIGLQWKFISLGIFKSYKENFYLFLLLFLEGSFIKV